MDRASLLLSVTIAHQQQQQQQQYGIQSSMSQVGTPTITSPVTTYSRSISAPPPLSESGIRYVCPLYSSPPVDIHPLPGGVGVGPCVASSPCWIFPPQLTSLTCWSRYSSSLEASLRKQYVVLIISLVSAVLVVSELILTV